jgi:hypothetical protein
MVGRFTNFVPRRFEVAVAIAISLLACGDAKSKGASGGQDGAPNDDRRVAEVEPFDLEDGRTVRRHDGQ